MLWIRQMLEFFNFEIEEPMNVFIDNISAIHMVRNNIGNSGTRHMNIKVHFVRELHEDKQVLYHYVRSKKNKSDILTKNSTRHEFEMHAPSLVEKVPEELLIKISNENKNEHAETKIDAEGAKKNE